MQGRNQPRDEGARMARTKFSYQETLARESCSLEGELHQAGASSGLFCSGQHPLRLESTQHIGGTRCLLHQQACLRLPFIRRIWQKPWAGVDTNYEASTELGALVSLGWTDQSPSCLITCLCRDTTRSVKGCGNTGQTTA